MSLESSSSWLVLRVLSEAPCLPHPPCPLLPWPGVGFAMGTAAGKEALPMAALTCRPYQGDGGGDCSAHPHTGLTCPLDCFDLCPTGRAMRQIYLTNIRFGAGILGFLDRSLTIWLPCDRHKRSWATLLVQQH
jgi:hypothetical protein